jgi:hypothetical protein|tara:strand:- start:1268 stop:1426 length:159 start_codon:yes stop_codon:yes gene_type:complete
MSCPDLASAILNGSSGGTCDSCSINVEGEYLAYKLNGWHGSSLKEPPMNISY